MEISVNGKTIEFEKEYISEIIALYKLNPEGIAVEVNGTIVHREEYAATAVKEGDTIEIVRFVGGG